MDAERRGQFRLAPLHAPPALRKFAIVHIAIHHGYYTRRIAWTQVGAQLSATQLAGRRGRSLCHWIRSRRQNRSPFLPNLENGI